MPCNTKAPTIRWFYLTIGILSMLFAGILYSWSILKAPLADAFGWNASQLTMNFTLTMCFFCLGGVGGGLLARRLGTRLTIALGGALACIGFVLTARLDGSSLPMLYLSYGVITATGIGDAIVGLLGTDTTSVVPAMFLAYIIGMIFRVAQGSGTVAGMTSMGIMATIAPAVGCHPVWIALACLSGSNSIGHINDSGFWVATNMSGLTITGGLKTYTLGSFLSSLCIFVLALIGALVIPL